MKKYLFVSDLHAGSNFGIMPYEVVERVPTGNDQIVHTPSASQLWLLERWEEMLDTVGKVDVCVCNGDSCDGHNRKEHGYMCWTTNLDVQVQAAVELLRMTKAKRYVLTMGSGYHVGENMCLDEVVAERLRPTDEADFGTDVAINDKQEGVRIHCAHKVGVSTTSWQYRSTPLAKELVMALLNEQEYGKFDVLVRSHAHYYCQVEFGSHFAVITPAWQLRTPYEVRGGLAMLPRIGYVYMEVDNGQIWKEKKIWSPKNPIREIKL